MLRLSILNDSAVMGEESLIAETVRLSASSSDGLTDRIKYKEFWVKNNGPDTAYNFGFYLGPYGSASDENNKEILLRWASMEDGTGRPYGLFTVWGYSPTGISHVSTFKNNTISINDLKRFQHNWLQGSSASTALKLGSTRTWNGTSNQLQDNLLSYNDSVALNGNGERPGLIKVLVGLRVPEGASANRLLLNHLLYYEEAV